MGLLCDACESDVFINFKHTPFKLTLEVFMDAQGRLFSL